MLPVVLVINVDETRRVEITVKNMMSIELRMMTNANVNFVDVESDGGRAPDR